MFSVVSGCTSLHEVDLDIILRCMRIMVKSSMLPAQCECEFSHTFT